jgi:hypothetical protein
MKIHFFDCAICSKLRDEEYSFEKYGSDDNTYLPGIYLKLIELKDNSTDGYSNKLLQCPDCGTFYAYKFSYEYLVNGSEDETTITRLVPTDVKSKLTKHELTAKIEYFQQYIQNGNAQQKTYSEFVLSSHFLYEHDFDNFISRLINADETICISALKALLKAPKEISKQKKYENSVLILLKSETEEIRLTAFRVAEEIFGTFQTWISYQDEKGSLYGPTFRFADLIFMKLETIIFSGREFDSMEMFNPEMHGKDVLQRFTFNNKSLCNCTFTWETPINFEHKKVKTHTRLFCELKLGKPAKNGGIEFEKLRLSADLYSKKANSTLKNQDFEEALKDISEKLGPDYKIRSCLFCKYSDYHVAGHGLWGHLRCYKNIKSEFLNAPTKIDFIKIMNNHAAVMYETDICDEFQEKKSV